MTDYNTQYDLNHGCDLMLLAMGGVEIQREDSTWGGNFGGWGFFGVSPAAVTKDNSSYSVKPLILSVIQVAFLSPVCSIDCRQNVITLWDILFPS